MQEHQSLPQQVLEHQFTAVVVLNRALEVVTMNSSAELLLVRSQKQLLGQPFASLFVSDEAVESVMASALEAGAAVSVRAAQWALVHGEQLILDYFVSPCLIDGAVHILVEMVPADRAVRISRDEERLDQSEASRHLVRGLAHEIKNPLGGIRGAAQLLAAELPSEELKEYTQVIIEEADRLRNLVDRLLGSHQLPDMAALNIHQVLERVLSLIAAESAGAVDIVRDYDPSIPEMIGDEAQLIQVFLNIARNALQALTEHEQPHAQLQVRTRTVRQHTIHGQRHRIVLKVDVIDNGPGIEQALMEKIFYPMISGRASGTGLGLSIVQQFVDLHRGSVECSSVPGQTQFSVYFPLEVKHD